SKNNSIKICIGAIFLAFGCILTALYLINLVILDESMSILNDMIYVNTSICFIIGSFLIYDSIRIYL
ncbi:MAG: hypothetical protein ACFE8N_15905, partial [Promethearchaeota archaeon]